MLEAYEKCRKGLERAVHKLQEEKEKQEEERRSIRMKWGMRGSLPPASESGGEKIKRPTPAMGRGASTEPVRKPAGPGGPPAGLEPSRRGDGPRRGDRVVGPQWREEQWWSERGLEYRDRWEGTRGTMDRGCYSPESREKGRW